METSRLNMKNLTSSLVSHKDTMIYKVVSVIVNVTDEINSVDYWTFLFVFVIVTATFRKLVVQWIEITSFEWIPAKRLPTRFWIFDNSGSANTQFQNNAHLHSDIADYWCLQLDDDIDSISDDSDEELPDYCCTQS